MNAGRYLGYYNSGPLLFDTTHPVLQLDKTGNLARVQYHESYRTPITVPASLARARHTHRADSSSSRLISPSRLVSPGQPSPTHPAAS